MKKGKRELNSILRKALLDAAGQDYQDILDQDVDEMPLPDFTQSYLQKRQKLLDESLPKHNTSTWKKPLSIAAMILLTAGIAITLLWTNPSARAWVEEYIFRRGKAVDEYIFQGEDGDPDRLGAIVPSALSTMDFTESSRIENPGYVRITYKNVDGQCIYYSHMLYSSGSAIILDNEHSVLNDVEVNAWPGRLYKSNSDGAFNYLLLFDRENGYVYYLYSTISDQILLEIAESIEID